MNTRSLPDEGPTARPEGAEQGSPSAGEKKASQKKTLRGIALSAGILAFLSFCSPFCRRC